MTEPVKGHGSDWFAQHAGALLGFLRDGLGAERDRRAEVLFRDHVAAGRIEFRLRTDGLVWRMPDEVRTGLPRNSPELRGAAGDLVQRSLFETIYEAEFSNDAERTVAVHIDEQATVQWWHRNVAKVHYGLQGWRRGRIYPDFLFAVGREGRTHQIVALETKGAHLDGNDDTNYKRAMLAFLNGAFRTGLARRVGELDLIPPDAAPLRCEMMVLTEVNTALPRLVGLEDAV